MGNVVIVDMLCMSGLIAHSQHNVQYNSGPPPNSHSDPGDCGQYSPYTQLGPAEGAVSTVCSVIVGGDSVAKVIANEWWLQAEHKYNRNYETFRGPSLSEFQSQVPQGDEPTVCPDESDDEPETEQVFPPLHPLQIEMEFPFREPTADEYRLASCTMNVHVPATNEQLCTKLYQPTNECVRRPVADTPVSGSTDWRPCHPDGTWDPSLLFRQFTFTAEHGPHTATFLGGSASITLSPQQIWDGILSWFATAISDVRLATAAKFAGSRKGSKKWSSRRTKLWVIPRAAMSEEARPFIWDLRSYWQDKTTGIHPVVDGDERRVTGLGNPEHKAGISVLQQQYRCPDEETPHRMVSGIATFSDAAFDGFVLGPNYTGFYDEIDFAVEKNEQELEAGILQGPFPGPAFAPCRVFATNVAIQPNGKKRRTGDGGWPRDFTFEDQPLSLNAAIDLDNEDNFPIYTLPSAVTFGMSIAVAESCHSYSGDGRMQMHVLLSDWVAYYRTFVLAVRYFWTQMNVFLPKGATVDTALYFGDTGAPSTSNHAMNWLLFMWRAIFLDLIRAHTSWDVATQSELPVCDAWDDNHRVRQWRQARYNAAT